MAEYKLLENRRPCQACQVTTVHGTIQTPVFMNVGTVGSDQRCCIHHGSAADRNTGRDYPILIICMSVRVIK